MLILFLWQPNVLVKLLQGVMCRLSIDNVTQTDCEKHACSDHSVQHTCLLCIYIHVAVGISLEVHRCISVLVE